MSVEAYPLQWPDGWPRTPPHRQSKSRFTVTFGVARDSLLSELRLLGARNVVLSTNLRLRGDGLPYADEARRRIDDPGAAVYFTLDGEPRVMARDLYWTVHENVHSIGHAIGHLRGLQRHGGDFMMKRAFAGFAALPAPGQADSQRWWKVLRVEPTATEAEIQAAYRARAKELHSDAGGNDTAMAELNVARDTALKVKRS